MKEESGSSKGPVACGSWIRRPEKVNLAVLARSRKKRGDSSSDSSPSVLQIFSFDPKTASLSSSPLVSLYKTPSFFENGFSMTFWKSFFFFFPTVFINRCNCFGIDFLTDQTKNNVFWIFI